MKVTRLLWLATALAAAGCDTTPTQPDRQAPGPSFAAGVTTERETIPVEFDYFSACTNEVIHFVGSVNVVFQLVSNASGGLVINGSGNFKNVTGVGLTSGLTYRFVGKTGLGFNGPAVYTTAGLVVEMNELEQLVVSNGSAPNQNAQFQIRLVIAPDGTTRLEFESLTFTCF
jgi:hypothetical protein